MSNRPLQLPGSKALPRPTQGQLGEKFKAQLARAMTDVQENFKLLASCPGPHDFQARPGGRKGDYWCLKCHGRVTGANATFYMHGLAHGAKKVD
jgi:hypothetical protein